MPATLTFQADVAPIRALIATPGFVWIGSERGLRRVRLPAGPAEWVGGEAGLVGRGVFALATDGTAAVLVATDAEVGRVIDVAGRPRYQTVAKLAGVTHLGPAPAAAAGAPAPAGQSFAEGAWAGTKAGLFFLHAGQASPLASSPVGAITSLDVEVDGKSAWVGVAGRGLIHVDARKVLAAFGPESPERLDFIDALGTAVLPNGTRMALGRGAQGRTRVLLLRRSGTEVLSAEPDVSVLALVAGNNANSGPTPTSGPLLLAGTLFNPRLYHIQAAERGELMDAGVLRFSPARKNLSSLRLVARPDARALPAEITVAIPTSGTTRADPPGDIFVGTRALGAARLAAGGPAYLPAGELALAARSLSVTCLEQERCLFATGSGPGWVWHGGERGIRPMAAGGGAVTGAGGAGGAKGGGVAAGGATVGIPGVLMAFAGDGRGVVYSVAGGGGKSLRISRLSSNRTSWENALNLPVQVEGTPLATFATLSPRGHLWISVRDQTSAGQEFGRGVIEVQLPSGRAVHHRPYRKGEPREPDSIPVAGDVNAVRFQKAAGPGDTESIWFCTSLGVLRFVSGQLSQWGENDGLDSETCKDLEVAPDATVWAATESGVARFDGAGWRRLGSAAVGTVTPATKGNRIPVASAGQPPAIARRWPVDRDGDNLAARALATSGEGLWAGTSRGLWPVTTAPAGGAVSGGAADVPSPAAIDRAAGLVDDDVVDLATDRFGRLWVLGRLGLTIRRPLDR